MPLINDGTNATLVSNSEGPANKGKLYLGEAHHSYYDELTDDLHRRVVPLLRKLGIEKITTIPTTGPEESPEKISSPGRMCGVFMAGPAGSAYRPR